MMSAKSKGMRGFLLVWSGQIFSRVGSAMTYFAISIWAWEKTGQATPLALVGFFTLAPLVILTPIVGAGVGRWNCKKVMAFNAIGAGLMTLMVFILMLSGKLEIWHLYITGAIGGIFGAFQWPAYSAAITLITPKKHTARTNGMSAMAESGAGIVAPILAAFLVPLIQIPGIIAVDLVMMVVALIFLLMVAIPEPQRQARDKRPGALLRELGDGFDYILKRQSLLCLQRVFFWVIYFSPWRTLY